jgi:hypothetical protein
VVARVAPVAEDHLLLVVAEVARDASHGAKLVVVGGVLFVVVVRVRVRVFIVVV